MSVDISALLRDVADRSEPVRLADPDQVRRLGDRRARRQQVQLVVGLALVVTMAVVLGRGFVDHGAVPQPVQPVPSPSPTATSTTATDPGGPTTHAIETGPHRFSAHAIAVHAGRFVVVGDSSDFDTSGPAVYWSDDAVHRKAPIPRGLPRSDNVTDVIATDSGFLAVGVDARGPAAWRSLDGVRWVPSQVAARGGGGGREALWGVTRTRLGYFAWGFDSGHAALWRSGDGVTWAAVGDRGVFDLPQSESICAVRETSGGLTAAGVVAPRNSREGRRVVWTSPDGASWVLSQGHGAPMFWCDPPQVLGHLEASSPAVGQVRIDPNGEGDEVYVSAP